MSPEQFKRRSFRLSLSALVFLLPLIQASLGIADENRNPAKEENQAPLDRWAGKPASGPAHVQEMVIARLRNAPTLGKSAPAIPLYHAASAKTVALEALYQKKPVVVFFTSTSCESGQRSADLLQELFIRYREVAEFALVYIREAHPTGGFQSTEEAAKFIADSPPNIAERAKLALQFAKAHRITFPVYVDQMSDPAAVLYAAWPTRVFVVSQSGRVAYAGQQGPWFFKPTRNYQHHLKGVPFGLGNLSGYSRESLEEFLEGLTRANTAP